MVTSELLRKFDSCLRLHCDYIYAYYQPPLAGPDIRGYARGMGIDNADYCHFYGWKNGLPFDSPGSFPGEFSILFEGNFVSLENAQHQYAEIIKEPFGYYWKPSQVVVMENLQGESLVLETDQNSPECNFILSYSPTGVNATQSVSKYDSFSHLLQSIISVFEHRAIYFDKETNQVEIDFDLQNEICSAINNKSSYWKMD